MPRKEKLFIGVLLVFLLVSTVFFGSRKLDYMIDEVWTFGLANHVGGITPSIEYGKVYSGMGIYDDYMKVNTGERFNYINVWENQANDVHPPLYYVLVHTICSLFPDTYTMWYGIAVNLIMMVFIIIFLYKLAKELTGDVTQAIGIVLAYSTSVAFFDTILFIRMYAMFTVFAILISYLLKIYWDKDLDRKFYILLSLTIILGMLTHYYYLIFTFFICTAFALHLYLGKRYKELKKCILVAMLDGVLYLLIWYHIAGHLFRGQRGKEAIESALSFGGLFKKVLAVLNNINGDTFLRMTWILIALMIVLAVNRVAKKEFRFTYKVALFVSACLYTIVVCKIAPYTDLRYVMSVIFVYYIMAFTVLKICLEKFLTKINISRLIIVLLLMINLENIISRDFYIPKDYYSDERLELFDQLEKKTCVVYISEGWEALYFFVPLQHVDSYMFVNKENIDEINQIHGEYVLATTINHMEEVTDYVGDESVKYSGLIYYFVK